MKTILLILLCLLTFGASARPELWQTTYDGDEKIAGPALPAPTSPWQPAMWTCGAINGSSTPQDVLALAKLCRDGGECKAAMPPAMYGYLKFYDRLDIFPGDKVPAGTLLIADFEGAEETEYPNLLCGNIRKLTRKFAQYPGIPGDDGINFPWASQMREVDFFCLMRGWANSKKAGTTACRIRSVMGDYVLMELYLSDPKIGGNQEMQFRAWSLVLNATRAQFPSKKILALVQGGYASPGTGVMDDSERHRLARFTLFFDAVWCFGFRQSAAAVMEDIQSLVNDPLHRFEGEESWKGN